MHPFEAAREYTRALNAVKLDRVFAKPFIGCLEGHKDGVSSVCKHPERLSIFLSGAFDGEIKIWNLPQRTCEKTILAHDGIIRGITFAEETEHFISVGDDKTIKTWKINESTNYDDNNEDDKDEPINTIISRVIYNYI